MRSILFYSSLRKGRGDGMSSRAYIYLGISLIVLGILTAAICEFLLYYIEKHKKE